MLPSLVTPRIRAYWYTPRETPTVLTPPSVMGTLSTCQSFMRWLFALDAVALGMVENAVQDRGGERGVVVEDGRPALEGLVGGRATIVASPDDLKKLVGAAFVNRKISKDAGFALVGATRGDMFATISDIREIPSPLVTILRRAGVPIVWKRIRWHDVDAFGGRRSTRKEAAFAGRLSELRPVWNAKVPHAFLCSYLRNHRGSMPAGYGVSASCNRRDGD